MLRISLNLNEPTMILCICKAVSERDATAEQQAAAQLRQAQKLLSDIQRQRSGKSASGAGAEAVRFYWPAPLASRFAATVKERRWLT